MSTTLHAGQKILKEEQINNFKGVSLCMRACVMPAVNLWLTLCTDWLLNRVVWLVVCHSIASVASFNFCLYWWNIFLLCAVPWCDFSNWNTAAVFFRFFSLNIILLLRATRMAPPRVRKRETPFQPQHEIEFGLQVVERHPISSPVSLSAVSSAVTSEKKIKPEQSVPAPKSRSATQHRFDRNCIYLM